MQILWDLQGAHFESPSIQERLDFDWLQTPSFAVVLPFICSAFSEKYDDPNCRGQEGNL